MAAKKSGRKKSSSKGPSVTLTDWDNETSAGLDDPQAVRELLMAVISRIARGPDYVHDDDPTDLVAVQILDQTGGVVSASKLIRDAKTLADIFKGTDLAIDSAAASTKGDGPIGEQIPLPQGRDLVQVRDDLGEVIEELWPIFTRRIEATEGDASQSISLTVTWHPPTENRDGYVGTLGSLRVSGKKITRTGRVQKKSRGGYQFDLFAESADE